MPAPLVVAILQDSSSWCRGVEAAVQRTGCVTAGAFDSGARVVDVAFAGQRLDEARELLSGSPDALLIRVVGAGQWSVDSYEDGVFDMIEDGPATEADASRALLMATRFLAAQAARTRLAQVVAHRDRLATLGLFATGVAHEISNPGAALLTNIELLRDEVGATSALPRERQLEAFRTQVGEWIEALDDCIGASQRIVSIVRGLNALSRRGRDPAPRLVDLNEELSTILRLIGKEVHFRSQIELRLDPALPHVQAAPPAVTQILTNLLLNALQAIETAPVGSRHVSLATRFDETTVGFEVTDSGAGLAPELVARAFDPFLVTEGLGVGFGLSITRELAEEAGAELSVESARGTGTTIRVTFPRPAQASPAAPRGDAPAAPTPRLRLLVVDDDELLLRSLTRLLASHFDVRAAKSATQALELLARDEAVDVVLADVVMPEESGVELFAALEQRFPRLARRTIFISGGVRSDDLLASVERTGRPCVAKPIEVGELTRLVRAVDAG